MITRRASTVIRTLAAISVAIAPSTIAAQATPGSMRERLAKMIRDTTLANGLTVIVSENHAAAVATVNVIVRTGAFTQEPGDEGISHIFEHVLFRAYGPEQAWGSDVAQINAYSNGGTSSELVTYYVTTPSQHGERATKILSDLVMDPKFRGGDLEDEVRIVMNEYERNASDPTHRLDVAASKLLWGAAAARKDPLGEPATIRSFTPKRLKEVHRRYYVPGNAAVIVTGDVAATTAIGWVAKHFGRWKSGPDPFISNPLPPIPPLTAPAITVVPADVNQVTVQLQWQGPSARVAPEDTWSADVFSDMVNSAPSGFSQNLRNSNLFQSVGLNYYTQANVGEITISGITATDRAAEAFAALRKEIERFDEPDYLSAHLLDLAKKKRRVQSEFGLERGSGLAHSLGFWWSVAGLDYFRGYHDAMMAVTLEDLRRFVTKYIHRPDVVAVLVPSAWEAEARAALERTFKAGLIQ